jgi:hypothetical protein
LLFSSKSLSSDKFLGVKNPEKWLDNFHCPSYNRIIVLQERNLRLYSFYCQKKYLIRASKVILLPDWSVLPVLIPD